MESKNRFNFQNPFEKHNYHLIVIGSSIEGLTCAKESAKLGAKVCVISNGETFQDLQITLFIDFFYKALECAEKCQKLAHYYGWNVNSSHEYKFNNWKDLMDSIKLAVKCALKEQIEYLMHKYSFAAKKNVTYIEGNPKFLNNYEIVANENSKPIYFAENYVIAPSGAGVLDKRIPAVKGADLYGTTLLDLMNISGIEGEILVVGDGKTATQISFLLSKLFTTTLMCKKTPVDDYDQEMLDCFLKYAKFEVLDNSILISISKTTCGRYEVYFTQLNKKWRQIRFFDKIIFTPQEKVKLNNYNLSKTDLKATRYEIPATENFQTNLSHIYVLGRAAKNPHNKNTMPHQTGRQLARFIFCNERCVNNICDRTGVLLGFPSYCFVGLTEEEAVQRLGEDNVDVYLHLFKNQETISSLPDQLLNYLKIICMNDDERRVLGMHLLAPYAPIVMQGYATALRCGKLTMSTIHNHVGIFPTIAREFTEATVTRRSGIKLSLLSCCS